MKEESRITRRLEKILSSLLDRSYKLNGSTFPPDTQVLPPAGRQRSWVHYGVMVPDMPGAHGFFNVLSIVGTPGATVFDNDYLIKTTPRDTAYLLSATASLGGAEFRSYSIQGECHFSDDGNRLEFGKDLEIFGEYPKWHVHRKFVGGSEIELHLEATPAVSYFAHIPALYQHWSLLCRYQGALRGGGTNIPVSGLCTFEYAKGVGVYSLASSVVPESRKIPIRFFTYQIINIDSESQLLLTQVLGPNDFSIQRTLYVRWVSGATAVYARDVHMEVTEYMESPLQTPDGHGMQVPKRLRWCAADDGGNKVLQLECCVDAPYTYGLGAGYVSAYSYRGSFQGKEISGRGYMEYIDRR